MKRKTGILLVAGLALTLAALGLQSSHTRPKAGSLFSWNRTAVSAEGIEAVLTVNEQLPLTQLFQEFPLEMLREKTEVQRFVSQLHPGDRLLRIDGGCHMGTARTGRGGVVTAYLSR